MQKLLIADSAESFSNALQDALKDTFKICVCHDGEEALAMVQSFQPDVMWLDMNLCKLDGITIIERSAALGCCPSILAAGCYFSDYSLAAMERLGVTYMMSKPCRLSAALARLKDMGQWSRMPETGKRNLQDVADDMLLSLRFRPKLGGYRYLREALLSVSKRPGQAITKEVYPAVAVKFGTNAKCVERVIRAAIKDAWEQRDDRVWSRFFLPDMNGVIHCPSNGTLIIQLADELCRERRGELRSDLSGNVRAG